jgi:glycosyltransferase involved in cell wall biosynthesis
MSRRRLPAHDGPLVSVVIPTHRREQAAARAVRSALAGGAESVEVIVIDDTAEGTARDAIGGVGDGRVSYHLMPIPSGGRPALVRNHGISLARGRYLYFLDDDDEVFPGALGLLAGALEAAPRKGVAYGTVECVGPDEGVRDGYNEYFGGAADVSGKVRRSSWLTTGVIMFRGTVIINSCCMIRCDRARQLGGYDPDLSVYEDVEFFTRGIRQFGHVFVPHPVLRYSTGLPSMIHDLEGETTPIQESYRIMHRKYRNRHGMVDYRLLQIVSKSLPLG